MYTFVPDAMNVHVVESSLVEEVAGTSSTAMTLRDYEHQGIQQPATYGPSREGILYKKIKFLLSTRKRLNIAIRPSNNLFTL